MFLSLDFPIIKIIHIGRFHMEQLSVLNGPNKSTNYKLILFKCTLPLDIVDLNSFLGVLNISRIKYCFPSL